MSTAQENSGSNWTQTNGYDRYGNRTVTAGLGQSLSFYSNNRVVGLSYDAAGNVTNDNVHSYAFDAENKIVKLDNVSAYVYDGEGRRVRKLVGENTRFIYGITGELLAEYDGSNNSIKKEYVYGASGLTATIEPTTGTQYLTADHLGSPRVVTNSSGGIVVRRDFMPFGEEITSNIGGRSSYQGWGISNTIRQQFTGYERDQESGLDFAQARYYSSASGRFTSVDPVGTNLTRMLDPQQINRYIYSRNNPLKYTDKDGNDIKLASNLKKSDADRIFKAMVKLYQKKSGREALDRMEKSEITYIYGTGTLGQNQDGSERLGRTEHVRGTFFGTVDPVTEKLKSIDRKGLEATITFDLEKRDRIKPPESEQLVFNHETGHANDIEQDPLKQFSQAEKDDENNAETFANKANQEKDTMKQDKAEKRVREILGLPPEEKEPEKKQKKKNERKQSQ